jgi:hypothetical protein
VPNYVRYSILTDKQTNRQTDKQTNRQTDKLTNWQTDKLTNWQTDKLTNWQTDKLTKRQIDKQTNSFENIEISLKFNFCTKFQLAVNFMCWTQGLSKQRTNSHHLWTGVKSKPGECRRPTVNTPCRSQSPNSYCFWSKI